MFNKEIEVLLDKSFEYVPARKHTLLKLKSLLLMKECDDKYEGKISSAIVTAITQQVLQEHIPHARAAYCTTLKHRFYLQKSILKPST